MSPTEIGRARVMAQHGVPADVSPEDDVSPVGESPYLDEIVCPQCESDARIHWSYYCKDSVDTTLVNLWYCELCGIDFEVVYRATEIREVK